MIRSSVSAMGIVVAVVMFCVASSLVCEMQMSSTGHVRLTSAALEHVTGGHGACYVKQTQRCPATSASCVGACHGMQVGDPCAAQSYVQYAPTYKQAKAGSGGQKELTTPVAKLCGVNQHCGPQCLISAMIGLHCPIGTVLDYELETEPKGPSCDAG